MSSERPILADRRILIVEDRYLVADDLSRLCRRAGAEIAGPVPEVSRARAIAETEPLDLAILDVDLRGEAVFGVAAILEQRGIPFLFVTGYGEKHLPERFRTVPLVPKPFSGPDLVARIGQLLQRPGNAGRTGG